MAIETDTAKIIRRLAREGWIGLGGANHDIFKHPGKPGVRIVVARHRHQSIGVARQIAKLAGWI